MKNNAIWAIVFLMAGTLLTVGAMTTIVPAAYAGGDDDGNKNKAEDDSAAAIADCDENEVEEASFECVAANGLRFTGQDILIGGISATLLSDETDPAPQDNTPMVLPLPT
jgi:hypothetical protein